MPTTKQKIVTSTGFGCNMKKNIYENYTPAEVLALAIEVSAKQGFVKSGNGFYAYDEDMNRYEVKDNKTVIVELISAGVQPNPTSVETAKEYIDAINGRLMLKKMAGTMNNFESGLVAAIEKDVTNFHVSIIASIPNSIEVDRKRSLLDQRLEELKPTSEHIGSRGQRFDLEVEVIDCKFIQSSGVFMITTVHKNKDVVKFWWRDQPDISDIIEGKTIMIRGTVNKHEINKFAHNIKETMLNRVSVKLK